MKTNKININKIRMIARIILVVVTIVTIGAAEASILDNITISKDAMISILIEYNIDLRANNFNNNFVTKNQMKEAFEEADAKEYEFEYEFEEIYETIFPWVDYEIPTEGKEGMEAFKRHIKGVIRRIESQFGKNAFSWYICQEIAEYEYELTGVDLLSAALCIQCIEEVEIEEARAQEDWALMRSHMVAVLNSIL